jgi:hypothetical protein
VAFGESLHTFGFPLIAAKRCALLGMLPSMSEERSAASLPANAAEPGTVGTNRGRLVRSQTLSPYAT